MDGVRVVVQCDGAPESSVEFWRKDDGPGVDQSLEARVGVCLIQMAAHTAKLVCIEVLKK